MLDQQSCQKNMARMMPRCLAASFQIVLDIEIRRG
jgi:hypothetical protein